MALNRLDLNLLHVFDTIYREGSLTRAARALHLTQPAVSHSLSRLRDHFDDPLFTRQGNEMVPTPLARRFLESMRPGLTQIQGAVNQFHAFDPATQRKTYSLGLRDILESTFLPRLMNRLEDFAVDVLLPVSNQTSHELLRRDRLVVLAREGHPLADGTLDMEGYLSAKHVLVSSRSEGPGIEDFELSRLGVQRSIRLRCQHYYAACRVVEETDLLLTMPEAYARIIAERANITIKDPPADLPSIDVHLYWHKAYEREPALIWFREQLKAIS